jgi:DNA-binding XRE family transcriptional regulator
LGNRDGAAEIIHASWLWSKKQIEIPLTGVETPLSNRFGATVKRLRTDAAMTQEELAHAAELHPTYISRLESGLRMPSIEVAEKLAAALKLTMSGLFEQVEVDAGVARPKRKNS